MHWLLCTDIKACSHGVSATATKVFLCMSTIIDIHLTHSVIKPLLHHVNILMETNETQSNSNNHNNISLLCQTIFKHGDLKY